MSNYLTLFVLALLTSSAHSAPHKCGSERLEERFKDLHNQSRLINKVYSPNRLETWSPIRFHVEYTHSLSDEDFNYIKNDVISNAITWFEKAIRVKRLTEKLKVPQDAASYLDDVPDYLITEGVEADYIFFVNLYSDSDDGTVGGASFVVQDGYTYQPTIGYFQLNYVEEWDIMAYDDLLATTIHEMTHALVFHPSLYNYFLDEDGELYTEDVIQSTERRGITVRQFVTPNIVSKARAAFGCDSLDGLELEISGGDGTFEAHWEKRVMYTDFMVADADVNDFVYSDVSVAIYEDSGWYKPNYEYTQSIRWGYLKGCDFVEKKCIEDNKATDNAFCVDESKQKCDFTRLHKGVCNLGVYSDSLPSEYSYFDDDTIGGSDMYLDYCPVVKQANTGSCRGLEMKSSEIDSDYGEQICENCRCVEGTYSKDNGAHHHVGCHWIECEDDHTIVHIGDEEIECPEDGGTVDVPNYDGELYCPKWTDVCNPPPCIHGCSGIGICDRGVCECPDGSKGGDCSNIEKDFSYRDPVNERKVTDDEVSGEAFDGIEDNAYRLSVIASLFYVIFY